MSEQPDCTPQCKSTIHGDLITAAITKRSISDYNLCTYLNYICCACESVQDSAGRTALHVAASCGRVDLVKWLVNCRHANLNQKDSESGYTPLHRSLFYGKIDIAVELIKLGANVTIQDHNSLTMLEHSMKDGLKPSETDLDGEVYAWGSNTNNVLGPQQSKSYPKLLDAHMEHNFFVQQVCIEKFHSLIVTNSGKVFSCGHGQGGRLGLGSEKTTVTPKAIPLPESLGEPITCVKATVSRDHSVFLCSDGNVYCCGLNTHKVLGISPPPASQLSPKRKVDLPSCEIKGVCSGRYHTVAYTSGTIFTWGLNAGQLGHELNSKEDKYIIKPKQVTMLNLNENKIKTVEASDGATAVCTEKGDIYILHEYQCRKIASRLLTASSLSIVGGKLNSSLDKDLLSEASKELKVLILTSTGNLHIWQESDPQLLRCVFLLERDLMVKQVFLNANELLFVSSFGEAFQGTIMARKKRTVPKDKTVIKSAFHKFLEKDDTVHVKLSKVPRIHRGLSIVSDPGGRDYCVIQACPYKNFSFPEIEKSRFIDDFRELLEQADTEDYVHDVVFKLGNRLYPSHMYLVAQKSPYLEKRMVRNEILELNGVNPDIFEQFLKYIYTGSCDLMQLGELKVEKLRDYCITKPEKDKENDAPRYATAFEYYNNKNKDKESKARNPVRLLQDLADKFGCVELQKYLSNLDMQKYEVRNKSAKPLKPKPFKLDRNSFPSLFDVAIRCRDGREIQAHKCVLAARLKYFNILFSMRWGGGDVCLSLPFHKPVVEALMEFLYTDGLLCLENREIDHLFKVLVLADHLFVTRLKDQCELLLTNLISLKNAVQLLAFAHVYNADKLKQCSIRFIIDNLAVFLELRALDELEDILLKELSDSYFNLKPEVWCRVITPYSTAVSDEEILSISEQFPVDIEEAVEKVVPKAGQKKRSRTHKTSHSEKPLSSSIDNDSIIQFPDVSEVEEVPKNAIGKISERLKAITFAQSIVKKEESCNNYTKLGKEADLSASFEDFPELSSSLNSSFNNNNTSNSFTYKSPNKIERKPLKLSQKQRKRLSSESNPNSPTIQPESPKNPWKVLPEVSSPKLEDAFNMGEIISHERKQKENLVKLKTKSLVYTQIEDKAIDELRKFYSIDSILEEVITVERVPLGAIAAPVWVPRTK